MARIVAAGGLVAKMGSVEVKEKGVKSVGEGSEGEEIESSVLVLWGVER